MDRVSVAFLGDDGETYWIEDEGSGIPPDQLDRVFDQYERLGRTEKGMGLVIAGMTPDVLGEIYDNAPEFLSVQEYEHVQRWAKQLARPIARLSS